MDSREAETCTTFGSSMCSEETISTATTTTIQLYSSSSNTIKTDKQKVERQHTSVTAEEVISSGQQEVQVEITGLSSPTTATTNSWNVTQETTIGLEANDTTATPTNLQRTSLAKQLGRRLTAPLTKANIKRCHRKLANLQLHHYHQRTNTARDNSCHKKTDHHPLTMKLLSSSSTVDLFKPADLENSSFCEVSAEGRYDKQERKSLVKNMQTTAEFGVDKSKKSPEKCGANLRQARRRKRFSFMRRSSKSAPG